MSIFTAKYIFTKEAIQIYAPAAPGVFGLYDSDKIAIYYGKSDYDLKKELFKHVAGLKGPCTKMALYFNTEIGGSPGKRLKGLLEEHKRVFENLPRCNQQN